MQDILKTAMDFIIKYLGLKGIAVIVIAILACSLVYNWHQHNHIMRLEKYTELEIKLRDDQIKFMEKKLEMNQKYPDNPP